MIEEKWIRAHGVVGFFPASSVGDDVELYLDDDRSEVHATLRHLRQQGEHRDGVPNRSLADYVAPKETGLRDHVGAFAVTAGDRARRAASRPSGPTSTTTTPSCSSRSATGWPRRSPSGSTSGCARSCGATRPTSTSTTSGSSRSSTTASGRRPGYPACPEHTEKQTLWELLDVEEHTGIKLTESMAMWPGASVSGFYYSHPQSQYFVVGRLARDQVADYAERKGWTLAEAERWLSPNLGYDPED